MSRSGFLGLAQWEGIAITERYGRRYVIAARLDAYLERCRIAPGSYGPELVPDKGHKGPAEVRHVDLLNTVGTGLSWNDARLAEESASTPIPSGAGGRPGAEQLPAGPAGAPRRSPQRAPRRF
jgi:hypothetical protein